VRHSDYREGDWHHLAVVYDATADTMSLYRPGAIDDVWAYQSPE
jgi:hypothetical protein